MPVVINFNVGVELKVANGTRGTLYAWEFPKGTTFAPHKLFADSTATVLRASHPVTVVYVRVPKLNDKISPAALQKIRTLLPEGFPLDVFPLIPRIEYANIKIKPGVIVHVAISQVPFNISLSGTLYKFQSLKYDWILLDELRKGEHPYVPPHESLYVAASRATHLKHLFLTKPLTDEDFDYFKPRHSVLIELARLAEVAIETKERLRGFLFGGGGGGGGGGGMGITRRTEPTSSAPCSGVGRGVGSTAPIDFLMGYTRGARSPSDPVEPAVRSSEPTERPWPS